MEPESTNNDESREVSEKRVDAFQKKVSDLCNELNESKRVIGRVVATQEVKPRKRIKLIARPVATSTEIDYKVAFQDLCKMIKGDEELRVRIGICTVCDCAAQTSSRNWRRCHHCKGAICSACLPTYEPENESRVNVFYCHGCTEEANKDCVDVVPGYQTMTVSMPGYGPR
jgi:hypothetical protein